jgi:hypothetical protein
MTDKKDALCECRCGRVTTTRNGKPNRYLHGHNRRGKGSGWIDQQHCFISVDGKRIALARWIMAQHLGRKLRSSEIVHHVDWNPLNNDLANLVILTRAEHARLHFKGRKVRHWSTQERLRAAHLYQRGMTIDEVACALGRPYSSTRDALAKAGVSRTAQASRNLRRSHDL